MEAEFQELRTSRLNLRAPREGDGSAIFDAYAADSEVTRFLTWRPHQSVSEADAALDSRLGRQKQGTEYSWILELRESPRVVGLVSAWAEPGGAELGFVLARAFWSQGFATESVRAVLDWATDSPRLARLWATCDVENRASARVLEKAGFANKGVLDRQIVRPNLSPEPRPSFLFEALLAAT